MAVNEAVKVLEFADNFSYAAGALAKLGFISTGYSPNPHPVGHMSFAPAGDEVVLWTPHIVG